MIVDQIHPVKRANDIVHAARRRVTWTQQGRLGRKADVERVNRRRLLRGAERLTAAQRTTLLATRLIVDPAEEIVTAVGTTLRLDCSRSRRE